MSPVKKSTVKKRTREAKPMARERRQTAEPPQGSSAPTAPDRWLVLVHQLPPRPPYLRAKIAQRLAGIGALALKNSVYVLPGRADCREDFDWIAQEAVAGGGQAWIASAEWLRGTSDETLREAFRALSDRAYDDLLAACRDELAGRRAQDLAARDELGPLLAAFRARYEKLRARDFFAAPRGGAAAAWLDELAAAGAQRQKGDERVSTAELELRGKVWVTRRDVFVDRIATAWLVRRYVDPKARFRFVASGAAPARAGEVRFDMAEAEVTHVGDRCTFEVLLERLALDDAALRRLAEMVHDIDLRDSRYGHPETAGLEQMLAGLVALERRDARRIEQGCELFDRLYRALSEKATAIPPVAAGLRAADAGRRGSRRSATSKGRSR